MPTGRGSSVSAVPSSRQEIVNVLRKAGLYELAEEAMRDLPDPVDFDRVLQWAAQHGVSREGLINRMGGSP